MPSIPEPSQHGEIAHWESIADAWRARMRRSDEQIADWIAHLGCAPGSLVLDAGCGAGTIGLPLAARGYRIRGVDLTPRMIVNAREGAQEYGLAGDAARFLVGDVERLPFPDATFDAIVCARVLDFAPRPAVALTEFRRVLAPGGRLLLVMLSAHSPVKHDWWRRFLPGKTAERTYNHILPWEMEALLEALGWRIIEQHAIFGRTFDGAPAVYTAEMCDQLSDRILQQTIAGSWWFTAVAT